MPNRKVPDRSVPRQDITGQKFNRLTAVKFIRWHKFPSGVWMEFWRFDCRCGKCVVTSKPNVKSGNTNSCGCYQQERRKDPRRHGDAPRSGIHAVLSSWRSMKRRCEDPRATRFECWGGRGIKVLWKSYEEFRRDMLPTWKPGLQIDRIDNNGHYCKTNCKWSTPKEQAGNRRPRRH